METSHSISQQNNKQECGRAERLFWHCAYWLQSQSLLKRTKRSRQLSHLFVILGNLAGNTRIFTGLVLMFGVAPLCYEAHLLFSYETVIEGWYYKNWFFWFFTQREEFLFGFFLIGLFLITKGISRYIFIPLISVCITEILFQSFQIDHWSDFYMPFFTDEGEVTERTWEMLVIGVACAFSFTKLIQYIIWLYNHRQQAYIRRMDGLCQVADMKDPIQSGFVTTWKEMKATNY